MAIYKLDKPTGITSAKYLNKFKRENNIKKAGYSGTLDPFASGLLIVGTDKDTKMLTSLLSENKEYIGEFTFGFRTDTDDIDGEVVEKSTIEVSDEQVKDVISKHFIGKIKQTPPNYSATKVNGVRAYKLARDKKDFKLVPKEREVFLFKIKKVSKNTYSFNISVSSGTYIRALIRDIAKHLETCATLTSLRRTKVGKYSL